MEHVKKQQGIVLVTAMVMIVAVTAVAVTLMSSSSIDLKITNAAQEREQAENLLIGEVQRVIQSESKKPSGSNHFLMSPQQLEIDKNKTFPGEHDTDNEMRALNSGAMQLNCPRSFKYTKGVMCNLTEISTTVEYGTRTRHRLTVVVGVGQQYINKSQGK
ncbi:pilus assembly PilX family protein [Pseudoalteromonas aurantia]|uniref:Pilus assembly protein PilX n=1 Tax=Pseudoalteromonas aurantia TaxID=43654 RepID=A0A5S3VEL1_9GAMM|nr:pilus assembly PilX N-terminal domain-containing protein [Pseudoalteromonas aurantia]TMO64553.1 pilus assembly protein PilX [Pseudoalteromonas aurantia]TMO70485.1 pilus assembly protein PilX [Pseudoalteromonas aurantia]TMO77648.1 pilus assembly protein PilX [Pseudoalteromonas aurantia]